MMYGYNPNCGAMVAPEYMQQPYGMQQPMMQKPYGMPKPACGCGQPMMPQPIQPYPVPAVQPMPLGNTLTPNYGAQMNAPMPISPNGMAPVQQIPYPTYPTPTPSYPAQVNPSQQMPYPSYPGGVSPVQPMPYPGSQVPTCGCGCGQPMMPQPVPTYQPVQAQPLMYEEPLMTTTNYKKTTYMEAYVPVETDVPLMQNVVQAKPIKATQSKPVVTPEYTTTNYTVYGDDDNYYMQDRSVAPKTPTPITCKNLPLAQSYVQPQTYSNVNDPEATLEQGTYFADLYRPYMGGYLK